MLRASSNKSWKLKVRMTQGWNNQEVGVFIHMSSNRCWLRLWLWLLARALWPVLFISAFSQHYSHRSFIWLLRGSKVSIPREPLRVTDTAPNLALEVRDYLFFCSHKPPRIRYRKHRPHLSKGDVLKSHYKRAHKIRNIVAANLWKIQPCLTSL